MQSAATPDILALDAPLPFACAGLRSAEGGGRVDPPAEKGSIVIVDDEVLIADSMAKILNRNGFQAEPFYNASDALARLQNFCPDVLLADVIMPLMNGIDLAVEVRRRCPRTRVLLFSGQAATADLLEQARDKDLQFELLPKPIHPADLLKRLSS